MNAAVTEVVRQEVREWLRAMPTPEQVAHDMGLLLATLPTGAARELAGAVGTACVEFLDNTAPQGDAPEQKEGD